MVRLELDTRSVSLGLRADDLQDYWMELVTDDGGIYGPESQENFAEAFTGHTVQSSNDPSSNLTGWLWHYSGSRTNADYLFGLHELREIDSQYPRSFHQEFGYDPASNIRSWLRTFAWSLIGQIEPDITEPSAMFGRWSWHDPDPGSNILYLFGLQPGSEIDSQYPMALQEFGPSEDIATTPIKPEISPAVGTDLGAALRDLQGIRDEANEEGHPEPTLLAIQRATTLVQKMYQILPQRYDIYTTDDGEIVIDGGKPERRIFAFCYPDGDVLLIGWIDGQRRRLRVSSGDDVQTEFLGKALSQLRDYLSG